MKVLLRVMLSTLVLGSWPLAHASESTELLGLQKSWADVQYQQTGDTQKSGFEALVQRADALVGEHPGEPEFLIWRAIIKATFAGASGGLGALGLAKDARSDLEKAMEIDDTVLKGTAYASLGTLYASVPGWPIGFGDGDKADELLRKAIELNPQGMESNYFYAKYLYESRRYDDARRYLDVARNASPRPGREVEYAGRQAEIEALQVELNKK